MENIDTIEKWSEITDKINLIVTEVAKERIVAKEKYGKNRIFSIKRGTTNKKSRENVGWEITPQYVEFILS